MATAIITPERKPSKKSKYALAFTAFLALAGLAGKAEAAVDGFVTHTMVLRAGPSANYPAIATIHGNPKINIFGCTAGGNWCDVSYRGVRGWGNGKNMVGEFRAKRYAVNRYHERLGVPVVTFNQTTYWNDYYRDRPFYRTKIYWSHGERYDTRNNRWIDRDHDFVDDRVDPDHGTKNNYISDDHHHQNGAFDQDNWHQTRNYKDRYNN